MTENFRRILAELFPCSTCCSGDKRRRPAAGEEARRRKISAKAAGGCRRRSTALELEQLQNGGGFLAAAKGAFGGRRHRSASCAQSPYDMIDEDEEDEGRLVYVRSSISQSIRLASEFSLNLLAIRPRVSVTTAASTETTL